MAAVKIAELFNINHDTINNSLKSFSPLPHRLELIGKYNNSLIYNDSKATNCNSVYYALDTINKPTVL